LKIQKELQMLQYNLSIKNQNGSPTRRAAQGDKSLNYGGGGGDEFYLVERKSNKSDGSNTRGLGVDPEGAMLYKKLCLEKSVIAGQGDLLTENDFMGKDVSPKARSSFRKDKDMYGEYGNPNSDEA
jgi:hypothetical protein